MVTTTNDTQDWIGYYARDVRRKQTIRGRAGTVRRWLTARAYDLLSIPYGLERHRNLLQTAPRVQNYTYTCFLRAPTQLRTISGPLLDHLGAATLGRPLEILVFAASNGAEVYSLASQLMQDHPDLDFHITASDLHPHMVDRCIEADYSSAEALQSDYICEDFVEATFDRVGDRYLVKPEIKARTTFMQANLLDRQQLERQFEPADIVLAQNVLFHLRPDDSTIAFENCSAFLRQRAALLIEGMDQDLRVDLTRRHKLQPFTHNQKAIYDETRIHTPPDWWNHYWGCEPYLPFRKHKQRRYGTIFVR